MVGILDYGLAKVADWIIKHVISAAVNYLSPVSFVEELVQETEVVRGAVLKIVPSHDREVDMIMHYCFKDVGVYS